MGSKLLFERPGQHGASNARFAEPREFLSALRNLVHTPSGLNQTSNPATEWMGEHQFCAMGLTGLARRWQARSPSIEATGRPCGCVRQSSCPDPAVGSDRSWPKRDDSDIADSHSRLADCEERSATPIRPMGCFAQRNKGGRAQALRMSGAEFPVDLIAPWRPEDMHFRCAIQSRRSAPCKSANGVTAWRSACLRRSSKSLT